MAEIASLQTEVEITNPQGDQIAKALRAAKVESTGKIAKTHLTAARNAAATLARRIAAKGDTLLIGATVQVSDAEPDGFKPAQIAVAISRVHPEVLREREKVQAEVEAAEQARHDEEVARQGAIAEGADPIAEGIGEGQGLDEHTEIEPIPWMEAEDPEGEAANG